VRCVATRLSPSLRRGISLIEVLISMFVLLFGLMGVAAIFPVGNYYVVEGEKYDQGSALIQNALEEIEARGLLRPEAWLYGNSVSGTPFWVIQQAGLYADTIEGPGHAFVIDPFGSAENPLDLFPFAAVPNNPWGFTDQLHGQRWPVRRVTLPVPDPGATFSLIPMTTPVAETIFRLRDDLAVEQPDENDVPSVQRWSVDGTGALLSRQFKGDYSWLATVVPQTLSDLNGLQPAVNGSSWCDVSVVVFRKRDTTPSAESERLVDAVLQTGGELELVIRGQANGDLLDAAVEDIRPGKWICLMGVHQTTGAFVMKWYRLLALDDETIANTVNGAATEGEYIRRAMLFGPEWPAPVSALTTMGELVNLKAALLPGAISVLTTTVDIKSQ